MDFIGLIPRTECGFFYFMESLRPRQENIRVNPIIADCCNEVSKRYDIQLQEMAVFAGASLQTLFGLDQRPITDIDILTTYKIDNQEAQIGDFRSVPWGLVFVNPLRTFEYQGTNIDLLSAMIHIHYDKRSPLAGLIYRFPLEEAIEQATNIEGIRFVRPYFTALYKLLYWRNGYYAGWDRLKRDFDDLSKIFEKGIIKYEEMIQCICEYAPDQKVQEILVDRLNAVIKRSDLNIQTSGELSAIRQWGVVEIADELQYEINEFVNSDRRLAWLESVNGIRVIGNKV